jgi:hypothetical protein
MQLVPHLGISGYVSSQTAPRATAAPGATTATPAPKAELGITRAALLGPFVFAALEPPPVGVIPCMSRL